MHDDAAPRDLRDWMAAVARLGQLQRIDEEVDWDEEMGAVVYLAHQEVGAPALLFRRIRGCPSGFSALWNLIGSSTARFATAIGEPSHLTAMELIARLRTRLGREIPPVMVSGADAPVNARHMFGNGIDITRFPAARHWPGDGGRYIGTCDAIITRDPDGGSINVGCYRQMVQDRNHVGVYLGPGKDARLHVERCWSRGEPCEVVACWGIDPATFIAAAQHFPNGVSEVDVIGGMTGRPVEMTAGQVVSLPYPARAEIVMEGVIAPGAMKPEGPFGEFTGYYGKPEELGFLIEVKAIHYRADPVLTHALVADAPANECGLLYAIARSARIWNDLDTLGVPGITGVFCPPAAAGGLGMTVLSLQQRYAGHASQALTLAASVAGGAYFSKYLVAVDEDIDPSNIDQVLWAMATRSNPAGDVDILRHTWSSTLDPAQHPADDRPYGSKALINACMDHRHLGEFSKRTRLRASVYEAVAARWAQLGFKGAPPRPRTFEDSLPTGRSEGCRD